MVYTAPATIRSEYDPTEQTVFTTTFVYPEENAVVIKARSNKDNRLTTFNIYTKAYDQDAKKYVESAEQEEKANQIVLDSFDEVDNVEALLERGAKEDLHFTGYTDGIDGYWYPRPPRPDTISVSDSKALKNITGPFRPGPLVDVPVFNAFQCTFYAIVNGEEKLFKVSQLVIPSDDLEEEDTEIGLKYINKSVKKQKEMLQAEEVADTRIEHVRANIEEETKTLRKEKVQELEIALGINVDQLIENKENIVIESVELKKTGTSFWLAGTPVMNKDEDVQFD